MNTFAVILSLTYFVSSAVSKHPGCHGSSIETPNLYKYILLSDYGIDIGNKETGNIKFMVKASNDAHVALLSSNTDQEPLYEIVLGGWANSKSVIRDRKQGIALTTHYGPVLKQNEYRTFYINWSKEHIRVDDEWKAKIMEWTDTSNPFNIRNIAVSTGWGSTGYWSFPCTAYQGE
ncbi:C3 and PZP-like alpha-2-macroglobulin domain-containing protein 8 [Mytilus californianus]|uniref:C3 and PZP-like alpha-2-macroglobulin domain-containing protein 8 n=1 Tax=Mytilus californianus TaxID=6549 RepID=UPI0022455822|nr:C3 and PZP-like alpha-2-macroglobulin domain-containing protein 8 [Mytilus californianus]